MPTALPLLDDPASSSTPRRSQQAVTQYLSLGGNLICYLGAVFHEEIRQNTGPKVAKWTKWKTPRGGAVRVTVAGDG